MSSCSKETVGTEIRTQAVGDAPLGRFNHHPDPVIDFGVEVEEIGAEVFDALHAIPGARSKGEVLQRINVAMMSNWLDEDARTLKRTLYGLGSSLIVAKAEGK